MNNSLEERCNVILKKGRHLSIQKWQEDWVNNPILIVDPITRMIHRLIEEADEAECLLSPAVYIRKYRKRWEEKKNGAKYDT